MKKLMIIIACLIPLCACSEEKPQPKAEEEVWLYVPQLGAYVKLPEL